jgi:SRSO17 transposase
MEDLDRWADSFDAFHARFGTLFARRETREQAEKYVRGLLAPVERKNGWQVAEAMGDATPDRTQRLLYRADWDADAARDILQGFVVETLAIRTGSRSSTRPAFSRRGRARWGSSGNTVGQRGRSRIARWRRY